jgi:hypothetical protein
MMVMIHVEYEMFVILVVRATGIVIEGLKKIWKR